MFEKEAEEWAKENMDCVKTENCLNQDCNYFSDEERIIAKSAFKDGAEFGYNKAFKTIAELEKENAELKEKLDKIRNYLANDIPHELMNEATNKIWKMI